MKPNVIDSLPFDVTSGVPNEHRDAINQQISIFNGFFEEIKIIEMEFH